MVQLLRINSKEQNKVNKKKAWSIYTVEVNSVTGDSIILSEMRQAHKKYCMISCIL
jgi:hypothetical protein